MNIKKIMQIIMAILGYALIIVVVWLIVVAAFTYAP